MGEQPSRKPETFDAYYLADFGPLTWFAIRIGASCVPEAEDVAQDAMRTALRHWADVGHPFAYTRMAVRRELARTRAKATRRREAERLAAGDGRLDDAFDQDVTRVIALLGALPAAQREVLALAMDGFEPAEIAAINGQNVATVRSNLRHARRKLIELMHTGREGGDGP
ncbi:RNA polymerase sigma factor [Winogradskya humida]|uniref:RNA polymerase sigma factor 70 region 4 type 2 domain-containing protein n=1 Tax=Winogradskya humida TaxID=113566 RepID=A0ABQ3ZZV3_9ACTN|nr:sigma-70 family RNA polymerase sigma factor [Actinoplanes humidus]GIE24149.1 hypothetical protein Ahu01nite_072510 [Actinoplanes humidus]